ncbi:Rv1733c family protein [Nocardia bovistercoris]|uniref:Uncharacterized protein n=1 Tax=Nocardia bovistercoris TaxID=2785916 RepID=A0A931IFM6_9NOCA|nr:hypothetical protein [Nocardia bovistercoris]MBH0779192.1 hypothetical protein [Nocardia bovistercoris]
MTIGRARVVRRACRRVGLDRNPLRRREDRWQTAIGALLALCVVVSVPLVVLGVGVPIHAAQTRALHAEYARLHRVDATVTEVGKTPLYAPVTPVTVSWTGADGLPRTATYHSAIVVKVGATLPIWLDGADRVTEPPSATRPVGRAVLVSAAVLCAVLIGCAGSYLAARLALNRRRSVLWESEWERAGLTWGAHGAS